MLIRNPRFSLHFLLFCFCALLSIRSHSQGCTSAVFTNSFDLNSINGEFVLPLPGGGAILGGRDFYDWTQVAIAKTTPDGTIVFNKRIDGFESSSDPAVACLTYDKNILIGARRGLVLVDTNGVVLRSAITDVNVGTIRDLKTDSFGNIYAFYYATGAASPQQWVVARISPDLSTVVWSAAFGTDYYFSWYSSIFVDGNRVFAVGSFPTNQFSDNVGSVLCFDAGNGSLLKQVALTVNGFECLIRTMHKSDSGYLLEGGFTPIGQSYYQYNHIILRLTDLLQPVKGARVTTLYNVDPLFIKPDDAGGYYACAGSAGITFFHCDRQDSVTSSRYSTTGFGGVGAFALSATNQYAFAKAGFSLLKADLNGFAGGCSELNVSTGTAPVSPALVNWSVKSVAGGISIRNAVNAVADRPFAMFPTCKQTSTCSFLKLIGPAAVCTNGTPVVFKGRRDPNCRLPVQWKLNGSPADLSLFNDSTLSVKFQTSGRYQLVASLPTPCDVITDTLNFDVTITSQTALDLGADRDLCSGNTIVLNAHKGYFSYTWQDGSTDSVFTVTSPGQYHVKTTDACGGIYKDTVTISAAPPISFDVSPDRTKCNNDTLRFSAPSGFMNYSWSPAYNISSTAAPVVTVNPLADTSYYVKAEKTPGCFAYDTIRVTVYHSAPINLGADQSFCNGDSTLLNAGAGFSSYWWNGISGSLSRFVYSSGEYRVTGITTEGCRSNDTVLINVWPLPQVQLDHNHELCAGSASILNPGSFSSYQWQDGSTGSTFTVKDIGTYYVQVTDNHTCVGSDTAHITQILSIPHDFLPSDTAICTYSKISVQPLQHFSSYLWDNGSRTAGITLDRPGSYWLEVVDENNCTGRDSIVVNPRQCMMGVYIPSAFTPNKDSRNDVFRAMVFGTVLKFELTVYNRWGQRVFYSADYSKGWDGTLNGVAQLSGGYVWTCRYLLEGGQETFEKGPVMLVR